jgi:DNA-directed RNA polymerase specialized sigma24 family protein
VALIEDRCNPAEQTVLVLTYQGRSNIEIAATLETTPGNVGVIRHRARKKLRTALTEDRP